MEAQAIMTNEVSTVLFVRISTDQFTHQLGQQCAHDFLQGWVENGDPREAYLDETTQDTQQVYQVGSQDQQQTLQLQHQKKRTPISERTINK